MTKVPIPVVGRSQRWKMLLNTLIVMGGALLSRVLGLVREAIFSTRFGTSPEFGAFGAAFAIPDLLYFVIIGGALGSALIPVFSRLLQQEETDRAWELANTVLTIAFLSFTVLAALAAIFARPLVAMSVAQGYANDPVLLDLVVHLMRLMLIQPLLLGLGGLLMAVLQTLERFALPAIAFNVYNLTMIAAALFLAPQYRDPQRSIDALAWGVAVGALFYFLVMLPGVWRAGLRFRPSLNWRMPEVRRVGQLLAPRVIGQSALQINIIVMISLISLLGGAEQAANRYAYQLLMLPHGILAISLGTVMFPRLTRLFAAGKLDELRANAFQTLRIVLWLTVPAMVILGVLHVPILRLLFQRGEFDADSLRLTGRALLFYTPGVLGLAGAEIVIRTFYAMEDTRTPVIVGVASIVLNGLLAWRLIMWRPDLGLVALAYSISNTLEFVVLFALLARRLRAWRDGHLLRSIATLCLSSLALIAVLIGCVRLSVGTIPGVTLAANDYGQGADFFVLASWFAGVAVLGLAAYGLVGLLLRAPEMRDAISMLRGKLGRSG